MNVIDYGSPRVTLTKNDKNVCGGGGGKKAGKRERDTTGWLGKGSDDAVGRSQQDGPDPRGDVGL